MATGDKKLGELPAASTVSATDLLLLEQDGVASQMSGAQLLAFLQPLLNESISLLPRTIALDFSNWSMGTFTETLDTEEVITHTVAFGTDGVPTAIDGITLTGLSTLHNGGT